MLESACRSFGEKSLFRRRHLGATSILFASALVILTGAALWFGMRPLHEHERQEQADAVNRDRPFFTAFDQIIPLPGYTELSDIEQARNEQTGPFIVNFFASWCEACLTEHSTLMALNEEHPGKLIGISFRDDIEDAAAFLDKFDNPYIAVAADKGGVNGLSFGVTNLPQTFLFDRDGTLIHQVSGPLIGEELRELRQRWSAIE